MAWRPSSGKYLSVAKFTSFCQFQITLMIYPLYIELFLYLITFSMNMCCAIYLYLEVTVNEETAGNESSLLKICFNASCTLDDDIIYTWSLLF